MSDTTIDLRDVEESVDETGLSVGLGVSTFYNKHKTAGSCRMMLRQRRASINYKDSDDSSSPAKFQRKRKGNPSLSPSLTGVSSEDEENKKPNRQSAKRSKMISSYEQMVLQNIEEKKQLLLKLNFLGQKKPDKPQREKRPKKVSVIQSSSRILRTRQLVANVYDEQDI